MSALLGVRYEAIYFADLGKRSAAAPLHDRIHKFNLERRHVLVFIDGEFGFL